MSFDAVTQGVFGTVEVASNSGERSDSQQDGLTCDLGTYSGHAALSAGRLQCIFGYGEA